MRIRTRDEEGVALVVALLVSFVVMMLSTVVISQAIHGSDQSAYNRTRLTSVNAAEAGLGSYFNYLEVTGTATLSTSAPPPETLGSSGGTIAVHDHADVLQHGFPRRVQPGAPVHGHALGQQLPEVGQARLGGDDQRRHRADDGELRAA